MSHSTSFSQPLGTIDSSEQDELLHRLDELVHVEVYDFFGRSWIQDIVSFWSIKGDTLNLDLDVHFTPLAPSDAIEKMDEFNVVLQACIEKEVDNTLRSA